MKKTILFKSFLISAITLTLLSCEKDSCDHANSQPIMDDQSFSIDENSPVGTIIGILNAKDNDTNQELTYSIVYNTSEDGIILDSKSGEITVADPEQLDYETNEKIELVVKVSDNGEFPSCTTAYVTIAINDLNEIPTSNMVAYYPFNGNANDESGNSNTGRVIGATLASDRFGNQNSAYSFDGDYDYIQLPTDFDYENRTICAWFTAGSIDYLNRIYTSDHPDLNYGQTKIMVTDDYGVKKLSISKWVSENFFEIPINENQWYFVSLVIKGKTISYYLNGRLIGSVTNDYIKSINGDYNAYIGTSRSATRRFFEGKIDDVIIYNSALSANDILNIYKEE